MGGYRPNVPPNLYEARRLSLRFIAPNGQPVSIRQPAKIVALRGYQKTDARTGEVKDFTIAIFENRETVFLAGHVDVIEDSLAVASTPEIDNLTYGERHYGITG